MLAGSTLGIDNWPARWEAKARSLEKVNWSAFRRDAVLMEGIQTQPEQFARWYARVKDARIERRHFEDSRFGSPEGREVDGVFATATSLRMAYHADAIARNWRPVQREDFRVPWVDVLDIGGGYGGMALALSLRFDVASYWVIDAEPCMLLQHMWTSCSGLPHAVPWPDPAAPGLVVNTNSFGEMDPPDVDRHFRIIEEHLLDGGAFYTMNRLERVTNFERYPYGQGWRHVIVRHPFGDEAWVECLSVRDRGVMSEHPVGTLARREKRC